MFGNLLSSVGNSSSFTTSTANSNNANYGKLSQKWEEQRKKWKSATYNAQEDAQQRQQQECDNKLPATASATTDGSHNQQQEQGTTDNDSFSLSDLDWDEVIDYLFSDRWRYHESLPVAVPLGQMVDILVDHWTDGV
mmetsp:Transcript_1706/g.2532  ORF Transcript_1706/g.2532 Transcript_1706/m.2532 type:complete len:137 (-) Transcript_1706:970-1380(-)